MEKYNTDYFLEALEQLNIKMEDTQINQFMQYYELLVEWNSFMNLTTVTEFDEVVLKHFVDSLSLVKAYDLTRKVSVIDIGTGAGFPGIPLKIVFPELEITLLDSLNKRVKFLDEVIVKLGLEGIHTLHGRAEDFAKPGQLREQFDLCVSRAVAKLSTLCELCIPYVKPGGEFISYKSEKIVEELETGKHAVFLLGGHIKEQVEFQLPNSDIYRNLFVIEKIKPTPKQYPRKAGLPAKEPIV